MKLDVLDRRTSAVAGALAVISILLFAGAIGGDFVWDDRPLVSENPRLRESDYLWQAIRHPFPYCSATMSWAKGLYRPVVSAALGLEFKLFGDGTFGYHLVNLLLNAACTALVFLWLRRRLQRDEPGDGVNLAAAIGAAVFACHPAHAESAAWISGSTDLWAAFWGLLGVTAWELLPGARGAGAAAILFVLSLYSKETGLMLPVALLGEHLVRRGFQRDGLGRAAIVGATLVAALGLRQAVLAGQASVTFVGAAHAVVSVLGTLGGYVRIALWPWPASTQVGYLAPEADGIRHYPPGYVALGAFTLLALFGLAIVSLRRPAVRPWLADTVWFLIPLLPVLNVVETSLEYFVFERSLYLASLGLAALLARLVLRSLRSLAQPERVVAVSVLLVAALAAGAARHTLHFNSEVGLWSSELRAGQRNDKVAVNLAEALVRAHEFEQAKTVSLEGLRQAATGTQELDMWAPVPTHLQMSLGVQLELLNRWMDADFLAAAQEGNTALAKALRYHEQIATGGDPEGAVLTAWQTADPPTHDFIRRSVFLLTRRAAMSLALGNFQGAAKAYAAIRAQQKGADDGKATGSLIVTLAAGGATKDASQLLESAGASLGSDRARVAQFVQDAIAAASQGTPALRAHAVANALISAREWLPALAVVEAALPGATDDKVRIQLLTDRLVAVAIIGRTAEAQRDAAELERLAPEMKEDLKAILAQAELAR